MSGTRGKRREEPQGAVWLSSMLNLLRAGVLGMATALLVLASAAAMISFGLMENGKGAGAVMAALKDFCLQEEEFAQAIVQGGTFADCMKAVAKGVGNSISDIAIRQRNGVALPTGLGSGAVLFVLLLSAGTVLYDTLPVVRSVGAVAGACLCGGGLAGVLTGKPKKKRRA